MIIKRPNKKYHSNHLCIRIERISRAVFPPRDEDTRAAGRCGLTILRRFETIFSSQFFRKPNSVEYGFPEETIVMERT